jgi:hypothetical protein
VATTRLIDQDLYSRKAVAEARQAFRDYCSFDVSPLSENRAQITIHVRDEFKNDERQIALEFLNYLLSKSAQLALEND